MTKASGLALAFLCAGSTVNAQTLSVGPNVQISVAHPKDAHYEVLAASDPNDASRIIVGSFRYPAGTMNAGTVAYATRDGGRTWVPTLDGAALANTSDPAPAFGPDGAAYFTAASLGPAPSPREGRTMLLFRSADGGLKWQAPSVFTYSDRQYITVDGTGGKYHGRVYVNGNNRVPYGISDFVVFRSSDKGATFTGPGTRADFGKHSAGMMGNAVIASDGTLIGLFEENNDLRIMTSTDGGATLTPAVDVDTAYVAPGNRKGANNNVVALPFMAIDASKGAFRDRLYAVWADRRGGHSRIRIATSTDKGATWSASREIDDSPATDTTDNFMATAAVNRDGVVGVMWYDRRAHADNMGWDVRFAASTDGGATFAPSVEVSAGGTTFGDTGLSLRASAARPKEGGVAIDLSLNSFSFLGGDTAGLVADAAGVFHPVWIDNRTGVPQVWTAPVRVVDPARVSDRDVSARVLIDVVDATFDRATNTVTAIVQLHNTSDQAVRGPFSVTLRTVTSDIGDVGSTANDWTFNDVSLAPGAHSANKTWRFRLNNLQSFRSGNRYRLGILKLNAIVLTEPAGTPTLNR